MNGCLTKYAHLIINLVTTVHQISQILLVGLSRCLVEILQNVSGIAIFAYFKRLSWERSRLRLSTLLSQ